MPEIVVEPLPDSGTLASGRPLTDLNLQAAGWALGAREIVSWKSTDGTVIEGVLHKPVGFQQGRRYPLLFVSLNVRDLGVGDAWDVVLS